MGVCLRSCITDAKTVDQDIGGLLCVQRTNLVSCPPAMRELHMRIALLSLLLVSVSAFAAYDTLYSIQKCYPVIGKYEEIAMLTDMHHRWVAVTPPDYAKVFLPTTGY